MTPDIANVGDDENILDAAQLCLSDMGWSVRVYTTGEAFLDDLGRQPPGCVLLDSHMYGMSGTDVTQVPFKKSVGIPTIGLTARPAISTTKRILDAGARAVLTKPVKPRKLSITYWQLSV